MLSLLDIKLGLDSENFPVLRLNSPVVKTHWTLDIWAGRVFKGAFSDG